MEKESDKYELDGRDIIFGDQIGTGAFGVVFKGTWHSTRGSMNRCISISINDNNQPILID